MNLSPEDLKRLAGIVYPGQQIVIRDYAVWVRPRHGEHTLPDMFVFHPSLTGLDEQQGQALEIIMAVLELSPIIEILSMRVPGAVKISISSKTGNINVRGDDILEASCAALLSGGGRG